MQVLNIGKLRRGGENYYLNAVARGVEDYYLGSGEAPGYWLASGSTAIGLSGEVGELELRRVLSGDHPHSGAKLVKPARSERVPGFDLTFRAPKSVALLHELTSRETRDEVMAAHDEAVNAALGYLERQASGARRGQAGKRSISSNGFLAAAFRHRTSRAGDPLLHTHVLTANLIQGSDGKWGALDAQHLYRHAKTAGFLYQAQLRTELTKRLGVAWTPVVKGSADIDGIDRSVIRAFSKRRNEIEHKLGAHGDATRREAEVAALKTRKAKDYKVSPQSLAPEWRARAEGLGLTREVVEGTLSRSRYVLPSESRITQIEASLASPQGLTEQESAFSRREALQGFCSQLALGADVTEIESMADAFLASERVIPLTARADGLTTQDSQRVSEGRISRRSDEPRYSTAEMLEVERTVIERAIARRMEGAGLASIPAVQAALLRRPSLFADQRAMVTRLTTSGQGVEVVVGKAGAGKTFALDAAREAWELSGLRVIGCARAARAAQELQAGSGIQSYTIASLLIDLDNPAQGGLGAKAVIVVDEAGMVGTRDLSRLLGHAHGSGAKVVLVGDDRQLPEIEAGGAFRGIKNRLPAIELSEVRRQPDGWQRDALDLIREGKPSAAIEAYDSRGRVHVASSAEETRRQLVADWWATRDDPEPGVMIAARRSDVAELNGLARALLIADGRLERDCLHVADREFSVGDRVMTLKNTRRLGIINGTRSTITQVHPECSEVTVRRDDGSEVTLPKGYLEAGHLTPAYAITGHKAQGMTTENAFILGDETLYREWAYVAMSRGKQTNSLYVVAGVDPEREELGGEIAGVTDPTSELIRALGRSRAKDLAVDVYEDSEIRNLSMTELRSEWDALSLALGEPPGDPSQELKRIRSERAQLEEVVKREKTVAADAADDIHALGPVGRLRRRSEVEKLNNRLADAAKLRARTLEEIDRLNDREAVLTAQLDERERWLVENAPAVRRRYSLERELWWREHQSALAAEVAMPTYLSDTIGQLPDRPTERAAWHEALRAVELYRARWQVTDQASVLGPTPQSERQRRDQDSVRSLLAEAQEQHLARDEVVERAIEL